MGPEYLDLSETLNFKSGGGPSPPDFWEAFSAEVVSAPKDAAGEGPVGHIVAEGTAVVDTVAEGTAVAGTVAEGTDVVDTVVEGTAVLEPAAEAAAKQTTKIRMRKADYASRKVHGVGRARSLTA